MTEHSIAAASATPSLLRVDQLACAFDAVTAYVDASDTPLGPASGADRQEIRPYDPFAHGWHLAVAPWHTVIANAAVVARLTNLLGRTVASS